MRRKLTRFWSRTSCISVISRLLTTLLVILLYWSARSSFDFFAVPALAPAGSAAIHGDSPRTSSVTMLPPSVVYTCGYHDSLAKTLFPSSVVVRYNNGEQLVYQEEPHKNSVMVVDWIDNICKRYPHRKLILNGESHERLPRMYPNEPAKLGVGGENVPYISWAATNIGLDKVAALSRQDSQPYRDDYPSRYLQYMASNCVDFREDAFVKLALLSESPAVATGRCTGSAKGLLRKKPSNIIVERWEAPQWTWHDNFEKGASDFRFTLCMEHCLTENYITEKILLPILSGSVPIYYGPTSIFQYFNRDRIIFYDINDPEAAEAQVKELEGSREKYMEFKKR